MMIFKNGVKRILALSVLGLMFVSMAGCQNAKCKSCLFDRNKETIDEAARGQVKQDPPIPPVNDEAANLDQRELVKSASIQPDPSNAIALNPTPTSSGNVAQTVADPLESKTMIPNAASAQDDPATLRPELGAAVDANYQAPQSAESAPVDSHSRSNNDATLAPQYQSVAPATENDEPLRQNESLSFAPSANDHSVSLEPEVKDGDGALPPAPSSTNATPLTNTDLFAPLPYELNATTPASKTNDSANAVSPPAESSSAPEETTAPTVDSDATTSLSQTSDWSANEFLVASKEPVTLKGMARALYLDNSASVTKTLERRSDLRPVAPKRLPPRSSATTSNNARLLPNGVASQIAPGVQLGVIDLTLGSN